MINHFEQYDNPTEDSETLTTPEFFDFNHESEYEAKKRHEAEKKSINIKTKNMVAIIETGGEISDQLKEQIRRLSFNIGLLDDDIRTDFIFAVLNNPKMAADDIIYNMATSLGESGPDIVFRMKNAIIDNSDIGKAIKNIKILQELTYLNDYEDEDITAEDIRQEMKNAWDYYQEAKRNDFKKNGYYELLDERDVYMAAAWAARLVLEDAKKESGNFFIRSAIEQDLEDLAIVRQSWERMEQKYDILELKKEYNIIPIFAKEYTDSEYIERLKEGSIYSKLNKKYAVIYNNDNLSIDSFFELNEENKGENPKKLDIHEILEKEGFAKDSMNKEDYKKLVLTYKSLIELPLRDKIEKELGIELKDYSIREQVQFVNFLSSKSVKDVEAVKAFLDIADTGDEKAKINRVKLFLSLEHDPKMSDKIFQIGEALGEDANVIFAKYAEIVDLTDKIREELGGIFKDDREVFQKDLELISQDLIGRANKLLVDFSNKVKITTKKEDILAKLENYESDLVLTASVYKSLKQSGAKIELEDFKGVTFEGKTANEISRDNELKQMLKIYGDNYGDKYGYGNDLKNKLVNNLKQKIENEGNSIKIYLCKKGDKIIVFNAFEDCGNGKKRGFAYNAIESMSGSSVGKCLLETSLEMAMADGETIEAECDPRSPMSSYYIEKAGFIVTGATDDYQKTGEPALNIEISVANKKYKYRDFERYKAEDIIAEQKNQSNDEDGMVLMFPKFSKESPQLLEETIKLTNQSYIMTRYVISGENAYCAFEKARA